MMDNNKANIDNLISLWKQIGMRFDAYHNTSIFEFSVIKGTRWPHRLWYPKEIQETTIPKLKEKLATIDGTVIIPVWKHHAENQSILEKNGFVMQFRQYGMVLQLKETFQVHNEMTIKRVTNDVEAKLWISLFTKSFGYPIEEEVVEQTLRDVEYYIVYHKDQAIGSAILHTTGTIVGAHGVGVPPEMRRRGYAAQIMKLVINMAIARGYEYMTLQASDMGKSVYEKLGFEFQFMLYNYVLQEE